MVKKELVELFTTSNVVREVIVNGLTKQLISGQENENTPVGTENLYHFSNLPTSKVIALLRDAEPLFGRNENYEVRSAHANTIGQYLAVRKNGILATDAKSIDRLLYTKE